MLRWVTIVLSVLGLAVGVWAVSTADQPPVNLPLSRPASVNPYEQGVAALGIVAPAGRAVGVVPPESGVVVEVMVNVGDRVKAGDALFRLDARLLEAELLQKQAGVEAARAEIARWHALPRKEDLPPLRAAVAQARAQHEDRKDVLGRVREASQKGSVGERDVAAARFAAEAAAATLARAEGDLQRAEAGGWEPDLVLAHAQLAHRIAEVDALRLLIDRLTVRAPRNGTVLRREIEPGEQATPGGASPPMILGDLSGLWVRAQIDEEDIGLVGAVAQAVARTRGAVVVDIPLRLVRIEPYARPKQHLSGSNRERVDTRVIEAVFEMAPGPQTPATPIYPGQAVDVFIESRGRVGG